MTDSLNLCCSLSDYGLIKISGIDSEKFLQGQLTCDVREVTEQTSRLGAHCDPKGRIQFTFRLFKFHDDYYLRVLKSLISHTLILLKKYAVFFKTKLEDVSNDWMIMGVRGHKPLELTFIELPEKVDAVTCFESGVVSRVLDDVSRYEIITQKNSNFLNSFFELFNDKPSNDWNLYDIISGIPTVYPETVGHFTPHQINYHLINGVSFKKGCYAGQEIVARMEYLGKLKQSMYRVQIEYFDTIAPGTKIKNEMCQEVGEIVQAAGANAYQEALVVLDKQLAKNCSLYRILDNYCILNFA